MSFKTFRHTNKMYSCALYCLVSTMCQRSVQVPQNTWWSDAVCMFVPPARESAVSARKHTRTPSVHVGVFCILTTTLFKRDTGLMSIGHMGRTYPLKCSSVKTAGKPLSLEKVLLSWDIPVVYVSYRYSTRKSKHNYFFYLLIDINPLAPEFSFKF
jgi:hypothetical protein